MENARNIMLSEKTQKYHKFRLWLYLCQNDACIWVRTRKNNRKMTILWFVGIARLWVKFLFSVSAEVVIILCNSKGIGNEMVWLHYRADCPFWKWKESQCTGWDVNIQHQPCLKLQGCPDFSLEGKSHAWHSFWQSLEYLGYNSVYCMCSKPGVGGLT